MAYEMATGPLDGTWRDEILAQIHELIQKNNLLTGASLAGKGRKNPAGKEIHRVPRARQTYGSNDAPEEGGADEDDDEDELEDEE